MNVSISSYHGLIRQTVSVCDRRSFCNRTPKTIADSVHTLCRARSLSSVGRDLSGSLLQDQDFGRIWAGLLGVNSVKTIAPSYLRPGTFRNDCDVGYITTDCGSLCPSLCCLVKHPKQHVRREADLRCFFHLNSSPGNAGLEVKICHRHLVSGDYF